MRGVCECDTRKKKRIYIFNINYDMQICAPCCLQDRIQETIHDKSIFKFQNDHFATLLYRVVFVCMVDLQDRK